MRHLIVLTSFLLILDAGLYADSSFTRKVDHYLQPYLQMQDFSGCVLVAKHGLILTRKCYGNTNYELNVANTPSSKFHIASVTKSFTAAAIVILQKQGKLSLTDKLSRYISDFPSGDKITIRELLEHSSGIPSYYSIPEYATDLKLRPVHFDDLIAIMRKKPLDFEPGTKNSYSDTGYAFLAYIIEKVSGKPYGQFVADEVFTPLGMKNSGTFSDTELIPGRASGYQPWTGRQKLRNAPFYDKTIITGSGSLYSTIDDLYIFYKGLRDKRLFDIKSLDYPYGWGKREFEGKKFIEQSGRDPGYVARIAAFLDEDVAVIVLGNLEVGADDPIARGLESIAFAGSPAPPTPRATIRVGAESLKQYEGRYEISPNAIMDVTAAGDDLYLRGPGGNYLPLEATALDRFFFKQMYIGITFHHDDQGRVDSLLWGGNYPCKRIADQPSPWE
jgi:CubicO group peptidase (beta-lactamase class C family)